MRFSDAIALGRVLLKPVAGSIVSLDGIYGCALGMGLKAVMGESIPYLEEERYKLLKMIWPWLGNVKMYKPPCRCFKWSDKNSAMDMVIHIFDAHVAEKGSPCWTLDKLIDWVRSVEPAEEQEIQKQEIQKQEIGPIAQMERA